MIHGHVDMPRMRRGSQLCSEELPFLRYLVARKGANDDERYDEGDNRRIMRRDIRPLCCKRKP